MLTTTALCVLLEQEVAQKLHDPFALDTDWLLTLRLLCAQTERHYHVAIEPALDVACKYASPLPLQTLTALRLYRAPDQMARLFEWVAFAPNVVTRLFIHRCVYAALTARGYPLLSMQKEAAEARRARDALLTLLAQCAIPRPDWMRCTRRVLALNAHGRYEYRTLDDETLLDEFQTLRIDYHMANQEFEQLCTRLCGVAAEAVWQGHYGRDFRHTQLRQMMRACEQLPGLFESGLALKPLLCVLLRGPVMPQLLAGGARFYNVYDELKRLAQTVHGTDLLPSARLGLRAELERCVMDAAAMRSLVELYHYMFTCDNDELVRALLLRLTAYDALPVFTARLLRENDALICACIGWLGNALTTRVWLSEKLGRLSRQLLEGDQWDALCDVLSLACASIVALPPTHQTLLDEALVLCPTKQLPRLAQWVRPDQYRAPEALATLSLEHTLLWLRYASPRENIHATVNDALQDHFNARVDPHSVTRLHQLARLTVHCEPVCGGVRRGLVVAEDKWPAYDAYAERIRRRQHRCWCGLRLLHCVSRVCRLGDFYGDTQDVTRLWATMAARLIRAHYAQDELRREARALVQQSRADYLDGHYTDYPTGVDDVLEDDGLALGRFEEDEEEEELCEVIVQCDTGVV